VTDTNSLKQKLKKSLM